MHIWSYEILTERVSLPLFGNFNIGWRVGGSGFKMYPLKTITISLKSRERIRGKLCHALPFVDHPGLVDSAACLSRNEVSSHSLFLSA